MRSLGILMAELGIVFASNYALAQTAPALPPEGPTAHPSAAAVAPVPAAQPAPAPKVDEAAAALAVEPGGLTARAVAERSVANSNTVRVKLADLDIARARLDQTTAQFLPRVTLRAAYTRLSRVKSELGSGALVGANNPGLLGVGPCPDASGNQCVLDSQGQPAGAANFAIPSLVNNYTLTAQLSVPISDYVLRLSNATAGASASERSAQLAMRAERLKVRTDAQALFFDWLRAKARVAVAIKSLDRIRARLKDARPAFELGTITKADVMRLEALAAATEQVVLESNSYRSLSELQLAVVMGDRGAGGYANGEDISVVAPVRQETLEVLTREAFDSRLELMALEQGSRSARLASRAVSTAMWPRLDATADVTYANPNQRYFPQEERWRATWSVGAAATWTMNEVFLSGASSRELQATARSLDAQRAALLDGVRTEVAAQYLARVRAEGALEAARRGLASAEEAYRVASDLYRVGKATTTDVIESETDLLSARLNEINARIDRRIADVRLEHAVGRDIPR